MKKCQYPDCNLEAKSNFIIDDKYLASFCFIHGQGKQIISKERLQIMLGENKEAEE